MRLDPDGFFQLTYCTNIHPSNGWDDVLANLRRYALPLKARDAGLPVPHATVLLAPITDFFF